MTDIAIPRAMLLAYLLSLQLVTMFVYELTFNSTSLHSNVKLVSLYVAGIRTWTLAGRDPLTAKRSSPVLSPAARMTRVTVSTKKLYRLIPVP